LKIKATVKDGSVLYVTEFQAASNQKYPITGKRRREMLIRWDNSPHYKNLKTFPHHVHESGDIKPSHRISVDEVIKEIRKRVEKDKRSSASLLLNIQQKLRNFAEDRNWDQFHSPKNLSMALAAETAELLEIFQWLTEEQSKEIINSERILHR